MSTYKEVLDKAIEAAKSDRPSVILAFERLNQETIILSKMFNEKDRCRILSERIVTVEGVNIVGKSLNRLKKDKYYSVVVSFHPNEEQEKHLNTLNIGKLITVKN